MQRILEDLLQDSLGIKPVIKEERIRGSQRESLLKLAPKITEELLQEKEVSLMDESLKTEEDTLLDGEKKPVKKPTPNFVKNNTIGLGDTAQINRRRLQIMRHE